jgi:hypothetical protein
MPANCPAEAILVSEMRVACAGVNPILTAINPKVNDTGM